MYYCADCSGNSSADRGYDCPGCWGSVWVEAGKAAAETRYGRDGYYAEEYARYINECIELLRQEIAEKQHLLAELEASIG